MQLIRTTLRLDKSIKEEAEALAFREKTTLQQIFNKALSNYIKETARKKAKKLVIPSFDLGVNLDHLTRDDFYD